MFFYSLTLLLILLSLCYMWVKKRFRYWKDRGFMQLEPDFPFGHLKGVGTSITAAEKMTELYKKFKGKTSIGGIYFFLGPVLMPIDPEIIKAILVKDFASFHNRGFYYNKKDDPLSANMLTLEGQEWRDVRTKLSPIFTSGKMKMMFGIVNEIGDKFIDILKSRTVDNKPIEIREWLARYTSDVIGNIAFGIDCDCLKNENSEFRKHGKRVFDITTYELLVFLFGSVFPDLSRKLGLETTPREPAKFFMETFINTIKEREESGYERKDFVQLLLQMKKSKEGKVFTDSELAAESFLFYAGGFETSSTLMTFCLYELALNNDIQEKLRHEIKETLEANGGKLTYENLFGMKYLDMVFNETLRKYPPIPTNARKCNKEFTVPGTNLVIPEGTQIELPTYALHHDPEHFPNPEKFDPLRFSEEVMSSRHPFAFLPFGEGPRNCIGLRFGLMQAKIGVSKLLSNFELEACDKTPMPIKFIPAFPFLAPVGGMWIRMKKITL